MSFVEPEDDGWPAMRPTHVDVRVIPLDIRRRLGFHRSTLSSVLDRLERDGLIRRPPSAFNGQRFELFLTPLGDIAADIADFVIREVEAELAAYTSRQERQAALDLFGACVAIDRPDRTIS